MFLFHSFVTASIQTSCDHIQTFFDSAQCCDAPKTKPVSPAATAAQFAGRFDADGNIFDNVLDLYQIPASLQTEGGTLKASEYELLPDVFGMTLHIRREQHYNVRVHSNRDDLYGDLHHHRKLWIDPASHEYWTDPSNTDAYLLASKCSVIGGQKSTPTHYQIVGSEAGEESRTETAYWPGSGTEVYNVDCVKKVFDLPDYHSAAQKVVDIASQDPEVVNGRMYNYFGWWLANDPKLDKTRFDTSIPMDMLSYFLSNMLGLPHETDMWELTMANVLGVSEDDFNSYKDNGCPLKAGHSMNHEAYAASLAQENKLVRSVATTLPGDPDGGNAGFSWTVRAPNATAAEKLVLADPIVACGGRKMVYARRIFDLPVDEKRTFYFIDVFHAAIEKYTADPRGDFSAVGFDNEALTMPNPVQKLIGIKGPAQNITDARLGNVWRWEDDRDTYNYFGGLGPHVAFQLMVLDTKRTNPVTGLNYTTTELMDLRNIYKKMIEDIGVDGRLRTTDDYKFVHRSRIAMYIAQGGGNVPKDMARLELTLKLDGDDDGKAGDETDWSQPVSAKKAYRVYFQHGFPVVGGIVVDQTESEVKYEFELPLFRLRTMEAAKEFLKGMDASQLYEAWQTDGLSAFVQGL